MSARSHNKERSRNQIARSSAPLNKVLQGNCACGAPAGMSGQCDECQNKSFSTQRTGSSESAASATGQQGLSKPGKPLDEQTRRSMEAGLGHDFSNVRVHVDEQADAAARSHDASAYTVGNDIAFASGR